MATIDVTPGITAAMLNTIFAKSAAALTIGDLKTLRSAMGFVIVTGSTLTQNPDARTVSSLFQ